MKHFITHLFLILSLVFPTGAFAGTWGAGSFVPDSGADVTNVTSCQGTFSITWTPTPGGDASGMNSPFTYSTHLDIVAVAGSATLKNQVITNVKAAWTSAVQTATNAANGQAALNTLMNNAATALNTSPQH